LASATRAILSREKSEGDTMQDFFLPLVILAGAVGVLYGAL